MQSNGQEKVRRHKNSEIMGYVGISRKNTMKNTHLPKISLLVQISGEIKALYAPMTPLL